MPNLQLFPLLFILVFTLTSFNFISCNRNGGGACQASEKQALLSFKEYVIDPNNTLLSSWKPQVDCCMWEHVVCDNLTGHVLELHLRGDRESWDSRMYGSFDPSLLNLTRLRYLDLSMNAFEAAIPPFFGSFPELEYLNLSYTGFEGAIPHALGNLSSLRTLVLSCPSPELNVDSLEWLTGLLHLEHLDMSGVWFNEALNWEQGIQTLPSLVELHLTECNLRSIGPPVNEVNFSSSLAVLDISDNNLQLAPTWISQLKNLTYLDLSSNVVQHFFPSPANFSELQYIDISFNNFNSPIPDWLYNSKYLEHISMRYSDIHGSISSSIGNLTSLNFLDLSSNDLSGNLPSEIAKLCIRTLDLSGNRLSGNISNSFGNLSSCFLESLEQLNLGENQLSGHLTDQFGDFRRLVWLELGKNSISGPIPSNLGNLMLLQGLILDDNRLTGVVPDSISQLSNLKLCYINDNMLEGVLTEDHFVNLTKLESLLASRNSNLTLQVPSNWVPSFNVSALALGSWNLGADGRIPSWLHTQKNSITLLDLSNTGIRHQVPSWIWEIKYLSLADNQLLENMIPDSIEGPTFVNLSSNLFKGSLPQVGSSVSVLDLSNNSFTGGLSNILCASNTSETDGLRILYLGGNMLSGGLPDCLNTRTMLEFINLENNNISGHIPESIGYLENLDSLNLSNNTLSGRIPSSLQNCTRLNKIDLANNQLTRTLPAWMGTTLVSLQILSLRSNRLSGVISPGLCHLQSLQILDLSDNSFSGTIPRCVDNFTAMASRKSPNYGGQVMWYVLYSSENYIRNTLLETATVATKGRMSQYDTILPQVTNIDLSRNNLSGDIPDQLTRLVGLRSLNMSRNRLMGSIPNRIGDMKLLESLDMSRNSLAGEIPFSLTELTFLSYLNLSYNNLTGRIPQSTQITGLPASGFVGNELCGLPLASNCANGPGNPGGREVDDDDNGGKSEVEWLYVISALGYAVGVSIAGNVLIFKKSWRYAFFAWVDNTWDKLYVYASIKMRRRG